jgi:hypothetical protein
MSQFGDNVAFAKLGAEKLRLAGAGGNDGGYGRKVAARFLRARFPVKPHFKPVDEPAGVPDDYKEVHDKPPGDRREQPIDPLRRDR